MWRLVYDILWWLHIFISGEVNNNSSSDKYIGRLKQRVWQAAKTDSNKAKPEERRKGTATRWALYEEDSGLICWGHVQLLYEVIRWAQPRRRLKVWSLSSVLLLINDMSDNLVYSWFQEDTSRRKVDCSFTLLFFFFFLIVWSDHALKHTAYIRVMYDFS